MLGYPGAGKTTAAQAIATVTGSEHLWADHIRRQMFGQPTYQHEENLALYQVMNRQARELLQQGKSVVFDTNFSYKRDRDELRELADSTSSQCLLIWVQAPRETAKKRATSDAHLQTTRVLGNMSHDDFERLSSSIEEPTDQEPYIKVDGTQITAEYIQFLLEQSGYDYS